MRDHFFLASERLWEKRTKPMGVADVVLDLASDEFSNITGSKWTMDGGILAGPAAAPKRP